tara:strand:- start:345 stop:974 length:630 start_codon:yes stop_codon:yes gene_type:complete
VSLPELGAVDRENGEFWSENAFTMIKEGNNVSAYERNRVFLNTGDGMDFLDASFASAADIDSDSRSAIVADFDQDGWPDLLVGSVGGGPLRLFLNNAARENHRIVVKLVGTSSNRHAVGSRVTVECGEDRIIRDLFKANGHHDQSPGSLLVGVGKAQGVDRLVVRWPTGKEQVFTNLPVDSRIELTEGEQDAAIESLDGLGDLVRNGDH